MSLFGFADEVERAVFQELTQVRGVGGRLAIGLLRRLDSGSLIDAVAAGDASRLSSVPGVGAKRAQAICFELKPRFEKRFGAVGSALPGGVAVDERVLEALEALGFSRSEGVKALLRARGEAPDATWGEEALLSSSLRHLSRR
jgi:Holliday junction DNA helicase RuvA